MFLPPRPLYGELHATFRIECVKAFGTPGVWIRITGTLTLARASNTHAWIERRLRIARERGAIETSKMGVHAT